MARTAGTGPLSSPMPRLPGLPARLLVTTTAAAALMLTAGLVGAWPPMTAVAAAVGVGALLPAVALVRHGRAVRAAARTAASLRGACRCTGMMGLGVLATGLTAGAMPMVPGQQQPVVATTGLTVAATLFTAALLHAPGIATTAAGRLRQGLDGLIVGASVALAGWLMLPGLSTQYPYAYLAAAVAASVAAITAAVILRAGRQRREAMRCGGGAVLAVAGLAVLAVTLARDVPGWLLLVAGALAVAGPPVIWAGASRLVTAAALPGTRLDQVFGGYPVLALPVAAMVAGFGYHLLTNDTPDRTAVLLGTMVGAMLAVREIPNASDLRRSAHQAVAQEAHLRALLAGAGDVTLVLDDHLVVRWQSPAAWRVLGLTDPDVVGRRFTDLVHPDDRARVADWLRPVVEGATAEVSVPAPVLCEARVRDGLGCWRDTESAVSDLRHSPAVGALVVQVRDVGQRRVLERTVQRLSCTDQLTGLANRQELLRAIATRRGAGSCAGTLLVVDLTGFEAVHDLHGRAAGDGVLLVVAQRLRTELGAADLASRLGERQLAVVTASGPIEAYGLGCRLLAELSRPYRLPGDQPVQLVVSVGLATLDGGEHAEDVVRHGDLAVRRASELGPIRIDWYDASLEEQLVRRLDVERHLPGAAGRGELALLYQPVVELTSGRPVGVEALLRWRHPVLGTVLPGELLPAVDRLRLSTEVGEWALHTACRQVAFWRRRGHDLWLALNVSARQLAAADFVPEVAAALSVHQSPPERLTIEITEKEIADQVPAVAGQLSKLRALGVRTGLDDVGTGQTDLARLRRLPLDVVKLCPPAATEQAGGSPPEVAATVVDVARRLGATVVAEGLETEAQRQLVQHAGCRYGQGYLMAAPSPAEHVEAYLERFRAGAEAGR